MWQQFCEIIKNKIIKARKWINIKIEQFNFNKIHHIHKIHNKNMLRLNTFDEGMNSLQHKH